MRHPRTLEAARLPEAQEHHSSTQAGEGRHDVGQFVGEEGGAQHLGSGEGNTGHDGGGPGFLDAAEAVQDKDQDQGNHDGEQRSLAAHNGTDVVGVEAREVGGRGDRNGHGAEGNRGGIGYQHCGRGLHRLQAQGNQHGGGDGHGSTETCQCFEQAAEAEGHQDRLDAHVAAANHVEDAAQVLKAPAHHGHLVQPDRHDHDPHHGERAEDRALGGGQQGQAGRHLEGPDGDGDRHQQ